MLNPNAENCEWVPCSFQQLQVIYENRYSSGHLQFHGVKANIFILAVGNGQNMQPKSPNQPNVSTFNPCKQNSKVQHCFLERRASPMRNIDFILLNPPTLLTVIISSKQKNNGINVRLPSDFQENFKEEASLIFSIP